MQVFRESIIDCKTGVGGARSRGERALRLAIQVVVWTLLLADPGRATSGGEVLQVGPARILKSIGEAARRARDGATVEVDAGEYVADVAIWNQHDLVIRAVGGRVRLRAMGASVEGKSIWVVRGGRIAVDGFDFEGARVPDGNGAGIRFEKGMLSIKDCRFIDNETGLLAGNDPKAELRIENSEFGSIRRLRGQNHNLYVGEIAKLTVVGSYFHHGAVGHLLKTRAAINQILYNRFTDESGGSASYELEFPDGGVALVIGNIVQQSSTTENPVLISFGAEGYKVRENALVLVHNTLVDNRPRGGTFLRVAPGNVAIKAVNNLLVGNDGRLDSAGSGDYRNNFNVDWGQFVRASREDYRLLPSASVLGKAIDAGGFEGFSLRPEREYSHPRGTAILKDQPRNPGALQRSGERTF